MSLSVSNKSSLIGSAGKTCKTPSCRNHLLVEGIIWILNPHVQTDGRPQSVVGLQCFVLKVEGSYINGNGKIQWPLGIN